MRVAAARRRFPGIPVIMISADEGDESRKEVGNNTIDQFIEKPFDLNEMIAVVNSLVNGGKESVLRND